MKNDIPIYAIDFEGSKALGIVEFGIVGIKNGEIFAAETSVCAPRAKISAFDTAIFGITNEAAASKPPFEAHAELFAALREGGVFASHSASVEDSLLRSHIPSPGRVKNFFTGADTLEWGPWLDSRGLFKAVDENAKSEKLSDAISALNLLRELNEYAQKMCPPARAKWHCALYDALASALIIKRALPLARDFDDLAAMCGKDYGSLF